MTWQNYDDNRGPGRPAKYPLRKMEVGESIFIAGIDNNEICKRTHYFKPLKFRTKRVVSGGVVGLKVTRTA